MSSDASRVLLAQKWEPDVDPTGMWMSEKLDGVRAYWSGQGFFSRNGNQFAAPQFFCESLPNVPLDGELWCGRGLFQKCLSVVKRVNDVHEDDWKVIKYLVFDAPKHGGTYEERVAWLNENVAEKSPHVAVVGIEKCTDRDQLQMRLAEVESLGGEGLMLRTPGSKYEWSRSSTLLKVKTFHDEEAIVVAHIKAPSGNSSLECELPNGIRFKLGSGLSAEEKRRPPKIGTVVTFKYQEVTDAGVPRFPVFLRPREDMTWDGVIANSKTKVPLSSIAKVKEEISKELRLPLFTTLSPSKSPAMSPAPENTSAAPSLAGSGADLSESEENEANNPHIVDLTARLADVSIASTQDPTFTTIAVGASSTTPGAGAVRKAKTIPWSDASGMGFAVNYRTTSNFSEHSSAGVKLREPLSYDLTTPPLSAFLQFKDQVVPIIVYASTTAAEVATFGKLMFGISAITYCTIHVPPKPVALNRLLYQIVKERGAEITTFEMQWGNCI